MSFKNKCAQCAARLLKEYNDALIQCAQDKSAHVVPIPPARNDTRLCSECHVFDDEEEQEKRIPDSYVNNPTDYL